MTREEYKAAVRATHSYNLDSDPRDDKYLTASQKFARHMRSMLRETGRSHLVGDFKNPLPTEEAVDEQ